MKFDRNTILGFATLGILFIGFFYFTNKDQAALQKQRDREAFVKDSLRNANIDTVAQRRDKQRADSQAQIVDAGVFQPVQKGAEQLVYVENDVFRIAFTTKGGQPKWVELKNFKNMDSGHVKLLNSDFNKISYRIRTGATTTTESAELSFSKVDSVRNADGGKTVSFTLGASDSTGAFTSAITHRYTIHPGKYMVDFDVEFQGADALLDQKTMNLVWAYSAAQQESSLSFEKDNTQIGFIEDGDFDYHTIGRRNDVSFTSPVDWLGVRQRFFNTFFIAKSKFASGKMEWVVPADDKKTVVEATSTMKVEVPAGAKAIVPFQIFYGPSDFKTLRQHDLNLEKLVNLGQGPYAFVRPLNRYVVIPVWDFIKGFVSNYGWVIAFLTLFIRLLISPLSYKSYLSGARMKALRPEIAKLKEKYGTDQQQMGMEQMKLFREAGVSPLGGCIPALLQIPIFFALYSFFSSSVDLRGADFLWAKDLSAYDSILKFGFEIPLLGDHLSLFTITAVLTSLAISVYSMSMSPDQSNPILKYMPYIFPVFLLFIFNKLPSALTWYYTVSNIITLILQFVIQNYIIDHNKILAKIEENRKKPKTKSKFQERMEALQEQQRKVKEMQERTRKK